MITYIARTKKEFLRVTNMLCDLNIRWVNKCHWNVEIDNSLIAAAPALLTSARQAGFVYDYAICREPTGPDRNKLTERNILRMQAIAKAENTD